MDEKEIEIGGCITVPKDISADAVIDAFIHWVESNGWYFGGGFREIVDGYYVDAKGNPVEPIDREENRQC
jgi:hypothetical protein